MAIRRSAVTLVVLAAFLLPAWARAAELHRYLPDDTELVVSLNVKQLLSTKFLKDSAAEAFKGLLDNSDEAKDLLKDLGFDPLKDLHRVLIASPGAVEADRGLIILQGEFDVAKFKGKADELVKNQKVTLHKVGEQSIYEVAVPLPGQQTPLFICVAAKDAILVSPGKDYVVDAIKKNPIKNPQALKNKAFQEMLEKIDDKQSLYLAGTAEAIGRSGFGDLVKEYIKQVDSLAGGIKLDDDLQVELVLGAKTVADARSVQKTINDLHTQGLLILGLLATQDEKLGPVVDILKSLRCTRQDKAVAIKLRVDGDLIDKLLPK
jgi:hypothetical protein